MGNKRKTLNEAVVELASKRKKKQDTEAQFLQEGWAYLKNGEKLFPVDQDKDFEYPVTKIRSSDSKLDIFLKFLPLSFLKKVLEKRVKERNGGLSFGKGNGKTYTVQKNIFIPLYVFAVKTLIQGRQNKLISMPEDVRDAVEALRTTNKHIYNAGTMRKLISLFYIDHEEGEAEFVSKRMAKIFQSFGDMVSGDEKLFFYSGYSQYTRQVKNKPAGVGLWMYQASVLLKCGKPCLIYTRMHNSNKQKGMHVKCHEIIKTWAEMIQDTYKPSNSTLFMDSYYLQEESRQWLKEKQVKYVASLHSGRFGVLINSLKPKVKKTGNYVQCFNQKTKEAAVHYWSEDTKVGRKTVLGAGFRVKREGKKDNVVPLFDHYGVGFSLCDKFNTCLHKKAWPYKLQGDKKVHWNYLFTCILINTYHLWLDSARKDEDRSKVTWQEFCHELAFEMIR